MKEEKEKTRKLGNDSKSYVEMQRAKNGQGSLAEGGGGDLSGSGEVN